MNVALRAVHERLQATGAPAARWDALIGEIAARSSVAGGGVRKDSLRDVLHSVGLSGKPTEWMIYLRQLGVLSHSVVLDQVRASAVHDALELVADSFSVSPRSQSWAPVITLPEELRRLLNPPPMRQTAGVLLDLIDSAAHEILLAAPFVDMRAVDFLSRALLDAGERGSSIAVVTSRGQAQCFARLCNEWSGGPRRATMQICELSTDLSPLGSHAKILVVDGHRGYVGSANITGAGFGRHVEIGVEVQGEPLTDLRRTLLALLSASDCVLRAGR